MSIAEKAPQTVPPLIRSTTLGKLACDIFSALDTLTLHAPLKTRADFETNEDYHAYTNDLRYKRGSAKTPLFGSQISALHVSGERLWIGGNGTWSIAGDRTDQARDNQGYFDPDMPTAAYDLQMWRIGPNGKPLELIQLLRIPNVSGDEPMLCYPESGTVTTVEATDAGDNWRYYYIRDIAQLLGREASALVGLRAEAELIEA